MPPDINKPHAIDPLPFSNKAMNMSPAELALNLENLNDLFRQVADSVDKIAQQDRNVARYVKVSRSMYNPSTGKKGNHGAVLDDLRLMSSSKKNPFIEWANLLKKSTAKTVREALKSPEMALAGRKAARSGQALSNLIVDIANQSFKGKIPNRKKLEPFSTLWFGTKNKLFFMKDHISKNKKNRNREFDFFSTVNQEYNEGSLTDPGYIQQKSLDDFNRIFYRAMAHKIYQNPNRKKSGMSAPPSINPFGPNGMGGGNGNGGNGGGGNGLVSIITNIINNLNSFDDALYVAHRWLITFGQAFGHFGELFTVAGQSIDVFLKITREFATEGNPTFGGYIADIKETINGGLQNYLNGNQDAMDLSVGAYDLSEKVSNFFTDLLDKIKNKVSPIVDALGDAFTSIKDKITNSETFNNAKGFFGSIGDSISNSKFGSFAKGVGGVLKKGFSALKKTPAGLILGAIAGVGKAVLGVFKFLAKHSPIMKAIEDLMNLFFTLFFMPIGNALGQLLLPLMNDLLNWVLKWNDLWSDFTWSKFWDFIKVTILDIGNLILGTLGLIPKWLADTALSILEGVLTLPFSIVKWLGEFLGFDMGFMNDWMNAIGDGFKFIKNIIELIYEVVKGIANIGEGVGDFIQNPASWAEKTWNDFTGTIGNIFGFAEGGIVMPTPGGTIARIAEAGVPEAVIPLDGEHSLGNSYIININGDVYGVSDLETRIETVINRVSNKGAYR